MKKIIAVLSLLLLPCFCFAEGLENGKYEISFCISDIGFIQIVTITNCTKNSAVDYYKFDVVIEGKGDLKRFEDDRQTVKGIVYDEKFKFIIPYANVTSLDGYYFEGTNQATEGVFAGNGDVPFQGPNGGNNKFHFQMKKLSSDKLPFNSVVVRDNSIVATLPDAPRWNVQMGAAESRLSKPNEPFVLLAGETLRLVEKHISYQVTAQMTPTPGLKIESTFNASDFGGAITNRSYFIPAK